MASIAYVARMNLGSLEYLDSQHEGVPVWAQSAAKAMEFENVREATRAAMRLPSRERAFAIPRAGAN